MPTLAALQANQPRAVQSLRAAIQSGRLHHAYLLLGPSPGQCWELAQAVAQALICTEPEDGSGCGSCVGCRKIEGGNHADVQTLKPNDKSIIPIDVIRHMTGRLSLRQSEAAHKVVIIAGADQMNAAAQNALLKNLEEPPGPTCFLLTAQRQRALLPTVRSRCQRVHLTPSDEGAVAALTDGEVPEATARILAAITGADVDRAQELLVDQGAVDIHASLVETLHPGASASDLMRLAAHLGADRDRYLLTLSLVEVLVRDRLAQSRGARPESLIGTPSDRTPPGERLGLAVSRLQELRALKGFHPNRTLALETLFLAIGGQVGSTGRTA